MIAGTLVLAFGTAVFILPFDLVTGGVSGIAIVLDKVISLEFVTIDRLVTVITWLLFLIGWLVLGKNFAMKTLISSIIYPLGVSLFMRLADPNVAGGFFYLGGSQHSQIAILLAALFGGVFIGLGCAITFRGGGSTGGTDVIAFIFCKYFKRARSSRVIFIGDALVVLLGIFAIKDLVLCLVGIISAFVASMVIDKLFLGASQAFIANIVSDKYELINQGIIEKLNRTSTIITAKGGYSGAEKPMVMVSFTMRQYAELRGLISSIDRNAFVTVHRAHEINGEGWTKYDVKKPDSDESGSIK